MGCTRRWEEKGVVASGKEYEKVRKRRWRMHNKESGCMQSSLVGFLLVLEKVAEMLLQKMQDGKADCESMDAYRDRSWGEKGVVDEIKEERIFVITEDETQCDVI